MSNSPTAETGVESKRLVTWFQAPRHAVLLGLALWLVPMLVVSIVVGLRPTHRTVTLDSYHFSAGQWWAGKSLYIGPAGMNYLPHFAVLFSPFHALPLWAGEVLWRWAGATALVAGLWGVMRASVPGSWQKAFFWASLTAVPLSMDALRNGNANAQFAGVLLLAIAAILQQRWTLAATWILLLTALKPLGVVLLLLAPLHYSPLRWRLMVGLLVLALFPFAFAPPAYALSQYHEAWTNLQACAAVTEHRFADINGLLRTFGHALGPVASKLTRVLAGGLTAILWWMSARRLREPLAACWLYALTAVYLMLFNPMTEANSYVILAPALGAWAAWFLYRTSEAEQRLGWFMVATALSMGLLPNILRPVFGNYFALLWDPLMAVLVLVVLSRELRQVPAALQPAAPEPVSNNSADT